MDLLGDLGAADQLTAARAENAVLQDKVKQLSFRVKELSIENESLKAEVEIYRREAALPNFSTLALGKATSRDESMADNDNNNAEEELHFLRSGNGVYPQVPSVTLPNLHGIANPLCCALSHNDVILATGGADSQLSLVAWGALPDNPSTYDNNKYRINIQCQGPVICTRFHPTLPLLAAGSMDGSVRLVSYELQTGTGLVVTASVAVPQKHGKYVKTVAWRPSLNLQSHNNNAAVLATGSADGTVRLYNVLLQKDYMQDDDIDTTSSTQIVVEPIETLHFMAAVESLCFVQDQLCCYSRDKPYLLCFDTTSPDLTRRKINLNSGGRPAAAGTTLEDQHVSFAVLDLQPCPAHKYLACATDTSRQIIVEFATGLQIRNLYGHQNDAYSNPKIAWSQNGQYLVGNSQDDASLCVWDIASSQLIARYSSMEEGSHGQTIRDLFSSSTTDTLVTTSFDKQTKLWFASSSSS